MSTADAQYAQALRLKPDLDRGMRLFILCAACHGQAGAGTTDGSVPGIAGQSREALLRQLIAFRFDARHDLRVQGFLADRRLTPQDLADVTAYVSSLSAPEPTPDETSKTAPGGELFLGMCARCHGSQGEGSPGVPRLAGQHREYLLKQLREATEGSRVRMERDHAKLLIQLSDDDMNNLAEFLAGQSPRPQAQQ